MDVPSDLTIFAAKYLVFIDAALAALLILVLIRRRPMRELVVLAATAILILVLSFVFAHIGSAVYNDPRPFTLDHIRPLVAHARDNGFPSDHALLAAAVVALVGLVGLWWALPFVVLGVLVDWARVGAGLHHPADVVGSTLFVALATAIVLAVRPLFEDWVGSAKEPAGGAGERDSAGSAVVDNTREQA